jgi:flagellar hook assembly protein FlgD
VPAQNSGDHEGRPYDSSGSASLEPNYPNPFNATTAIVYSLPNIGAQPAPVRLTVYNILGEKVKSLVDDNQQPGRHIAYWDGTDQQGQPVASGVYFYRLEVSGIEFVKSGKMVALK